MAVVHTPYASAPRASTTAAFAWYDSVEDGDVSEYSGSNALSAGTDGTLGVTPKDGTYWGAVSGNQANDGWGWIDAFSLDASTGQGAITEFWYVMAETSGSMRTCMFESYNGNAGDTPIGYWIRYHTNGSIDLFKGDHSASNILASTRFSWNVDEFMRSSIGFYNGTAYATVRIYINENLVFEKLSTPLQQGDQFWDVARIHWPTGRVYGVDEIRPAPPVGEKPTITESMASSGLCTDQELY